MPSSAQMRNHMILGQLYTNEILDERILQTMTDIPREPFLPERLQHAAYVDDDLDVGNGRFLMEPLIFAKLLHLADITPVCHVLNIGCLTGYSAAILSRLASHIVAIDSDANALDQAREHMKRMSITNVNLQQVGDMAEGFAPSAPYNVIVVQGAVDTIPAALSAQLAVNGRLVCIRNMAKRPGKCGGLGKGLVITKIEQTLQHREYFDASCPLLQGFEEKPGFRL